MWKSLTLCQTLSSLTLLTCCENQAKSTPSRLWRIPSSLSPWVTYSLPTKLSEISGHSSKTKTSKKTQVLSSYRMSTSHWSKLTTKETWRGENRTHRSSRISSCQDTSTRPRAWAPSLSRPQKPDLAIESLSRLPSWTMLKPKTPISHRQTWRSSFKRVSTHRRSLTSHHREAVTRLSLLGRDRTPCLVRGHRCRLTRIRTY